MCVLTAVNWRHLTSKVNGFMPKKITSTLCLFAFALQLVLPVRPTNACPFCLAPPQTWAEILSGADVVIVGEIIQRQTFEAEHRAQSEFLIREVRLPGRMQQQVSLLHPAGQSGALRGNTDDSLTVLLRPGMTLRLDQYVTGLPGDLFLLVGHRLQPVETAGGSTFEFTQTETASPIRQVSASSEIGDTAVANPDTSITVADVISINPDEFAAGAAAEADAATGDDVSIRDTDNQLSRGDRASFQYPGVLVPELMQWDVSAMSSTAISYILQAPDNALPATMRLPYYVSFLESSDPEIAADAWGEFARSQYEDVKMASKLLSPDRVRQWIADPKMSPERLGLYGMMLGLCGTADDVAFLRMQIGVPSADRPFRYGSEGLMGGLMLLDESGGLAFLEQTRLAASGCSSDELFAAVQAIQFIWSYEPDCIPHDRLRGSLHGLLANPLLRELVITNLARWQDWPTAPRLVKLFETLGDDDPGSRRAIVMFMFALQKAAATSDVPTELQDLAAGFLKHVETTHPQLLNAVTRDFRIQ